MKKSGQKPRRPSWRRAKKRAKVGVYTFRESAGNRVVRALRGAVIVTEKFAKSTELLNTSLAELDKELSVT